MKKIQFGKNLCAVILAAGKGKRMNAKNKNKVTYEVVGKPMITRTITILRQSGISRIIVVVGFAKHSVLALLDKDIVWVEQRKRLGTGHALRLAVKKVSASTRNILVLNGDDSFYYSRKIFSALYAVHVKRKNQLTFLTIETTNPAGLGRIVRDKKGQVKKIIEEKDAGESEKKIREINPACYIFSKDFLTRFLGKIPKNKLTGEYYVTSLVGEAVTARQKIDTLKIKNLHWRGINTPEELKIAESYLGKKNHE